MLPIIKKKRKEMKSDIAILLHYKGSGFGSAPELDFSEFEDLKTDLQKNYITNFRDTGLPQAGGVLDLIVDIFTNEAFIELTEIIKDGLVFDLIVNRKKSILLKPLFKSFQKMETKTECWDYTKIRFNFDDTTIVIIGARRLFMSIVGKVFPEILKKYNNLKLKEDGYPTKIIMPILKTDWGKNDEDRWISPEGDGEEFVYDDYLNFWGLEYGSQYNRKIYDFKNNEILDIEWD